MPETLHSNRAVQRAAVLGAGVMGAQIAAHLANLGIQTLLLDLPVDGRPNARAEGALKQLAKASPAPFFLPQYAARISVGNFHDDLPKLAQVDWVIEAVVEHLDVKQALLGQVAEHLPPHAVLATNTSGLSVSAIAQNLPAEVRARFLGMHFFNPPRYQKLLEIIPHAHTAPEVLAWARAFAESRLGKGVVVARDTPNFIGNRIGVFAIAIALREWTQHGLSLPAIEALTGPAVGRPKSATFRTADLVGLDVLAHVSQHLASANDEAADVFQLPPVVGKLIADKRLGAKTKAGFYSKTAEGILAVDPDTLAYVPAESPKWPILATLKKTPDLGERLRLLYQDDSEAGASFRRSTLALLLYAARRIGEITDDPADVDRAMRWGFAWELGPFEIWDALGFDVVCDALEAASETLPSWICERRKSGKSGFYGAAGALGVSAPVSEPTPNRLPLVAQHAGYSLHDLGEGVLCLTFRTKANTISTAVLKGIHETIAMVEADDAWKGLVIGNEGARFSAGADLSEMAGAVMARNFEPVDQMIRLFQQTGQRIRRAGKPVVVCVHGQTLGGGCELAMAAQAVVAAAESYVGLVELGVGLVPAGGGCLRMAATAAARGNQDPNRAADFLEDAFKAIGTATVATSAAQAIQIGYLPATTVVVLDADKRFAAARAEVLRHHAQGWQPAADDGVLALGASVAARFRVMADNLAAGSQISQYDAHLATKLGKILTGGGITIPAIVPEACILDLERTIFLELLQNPKTIERIQSILQHNKPLRN